MFAVAGTWVPQTNLLVTGNRLGIFELLLVLVGDFIGIFKTIPGLYKQQIKICPVISKNVA